MLYNTVVTCSNVGSTSYKVRSAPHPILINKHSFWIENLQYFYFFYIFRVDLSVWSCMTFLEFSQGMFFVKKTDPPQKKTHPSPQINKYMTICP